MGIYPPLKLGHLRRRDVRFGSKADMCSAKGHVRFAPESGHMRCNNKCPLCANSGIRKLVSVVRGQ
jgi:hypothetical protein